MKAAELVKLIESNGWHFARNGKGSHRIYEKEGNPDHISVPDHGKKDLPPGLLNKLLKQAGLK